MNEQYTEEHVKIVPVYVYASGRARLFQCFRSAWKYLLSHFSLFLRKSAAVSGNLNKQKKDYITSTKRNAAACSYLPNLSIKQLPTCHRKLNYLIFGGSRKHQTTILVMSNRDISYDAFFFHTKRSKCWPSAAMFIGSLSFTKATTLLSIHGSIARYTLGIFPCRFCFWFRFIHMVLNMTFQQKSSVLSSGCPPGQGSGHCGQSKGSESSCQRKVWLILKYESVLRYAETTFLAESSHRSLT